MQPTDIQLFGREREIGRIEAFVAEATASGGALLITGDAGVGKTELLEVAASTASKRGYTVVRATGAEFEADLSFAGLHQVIYPFIGTIDTLSSAHQRALRAAMGFVEGTAPDQLAVSNAALALLRQAAHERPLVVIVDDLHWIDRASALVLGFVARRLGGSAVAFLGALRNGEDTIFDRSGLRKLDVQPLDDAAASRLLGSRFPALAPRVRARLIREAEGNPLALLELPVSLAASQRSHAAPLPAVLPLGRRLESVFAARFQQLPAATRRLLLTAVLDGTGDLEVLMQSSDRDVLKTLAPAERGRLVQVDSATSRVLFRHPLIRSAVVARSTASERQELHRVLAERYASDADRRAWHLAEAADGPDEEVASLLQSVARRNLRRGDALGAIDQLLRAADLSPQGTSRAVRLSEAAYLGVTVNGDLRSVAALMTEVREVDPEHTGSLAGAVVGAYDLLNGGGAVDAAHRLLVSAIEAIPDNSDAHNKTLQEAIYNLAEICFFHGGADAWLPYHTALQRLVPRPPELLAIVGATFADPAHAALPMLPRLDAAIAELHVELSPARTVRIGVAAAYVDRLHACRTALQRVVEQGSYGAAITSAIQALFLLSNDAFFTGRWDEANALASQGLELSRSHGYEMLTGPGVFLQGLVSAARGQDEIARKLSSELAQWAEPRKVGLVLTYAAHIRALAELSRGDFENAYQHASSISPAGVFPSHAPHALWVILDLVEAAVRTGREAQAEAHVIAARRANIAEISERLALVVHGATAMVAPQDEQADLFEQALSVRDGQQWPFEYARIQLAYGVRLRRAKLVARARPHLSKALETFERLSARPWAARASSELRATGLAVKPPQNGGMAGLTQQEREIALLAAQGLTNKQIGERLFLSHRTVATHLYQIFPKLGISSRAALRDALTFAEAAR